MTSRVAVAELEALVTSATSKEVRLGAARDLVDRSVGKSPRPGRSGRIDHRDTTVVAQR